MAKSKGLTRENTQLDLKSQIDKQIQLNVMAEYIHLIEVERRIKKGRDQA